MRRQAEAEEGVECAMKMQLKISIQRAQYIAQCSVKKIDANCPLFPEYNCKDAYNLCDI